MALLALVQAVSANAEDAAEASIKVLRMAKSLVASSYSVCALACAVLASSQTAVIASFDA